MTDGVLLMLGVLALAGAAVLIYRVLLIRRAERMDQRLDLKTELTPEERRERLEEAAELSAVVVSQASGLAKSLNMYRPRMIRSGIYAPYAAALFLAAKVVLVLAVALAAALLLQPHHWAGLESKLLFVGVLITAWFLPDAFLLIHARDRRLGLLKGLPEWLDLHATMVEGGMGFDAALARIVEETRDTKEPIYIELRIVQKEMLMGSDRLRALRRMGERTRIEELEQVVAALAQADRLGAGIISALRAQADMTRNKVWEKARENAEKLSTKMLFPIFLGILPMFYVLTIWPLVLRVLEIFRGIR